MSNPPAAPQAPPPNGNGSRQGMMRWSVDVIRSLTIQNVLTLALLIVVLVPTYFAYRFLNDEEFRNDFMTSGKLVEAGVPCAVYEGNILGGTVVRSTVAHSYDVRDQLEFLVAVRAKSKLDPAAIAEACKQLHADAELIHKAKGAQP